MVQKSHAPAGSYVPIEIPTGAGSRDHPRAMKVKLCYGKSLWSMEKSTINGDFLQLCNKLPEGNWN